MSKSVLIVSYLFEPLNAIGSLRPSKLAKYLSNKGYEVTVFTSHKTLTCKEYKPLNFSIIYDLENVRTVKSTDSVSHNKHKIDIPIVFPSGLRDELKALYRTSLVYKESILFLDRFKEQLINKRIDASNFDCVITTYGPVGSLLAGIAIKRIQPSIKWINDFRDPIVTKLPPHSIKLFNLKLQNYSVKLCDKVTTVSKGYRNRIKQGTDISKFAIIPNGFDSDEIQNIPIISSTSFFDMAYVGSLYEGKRDLGPLFEALRQIIDEGVLPKSKIVFHYAGRDISYLHEQAKRYSISEIIHDHGFLSREECLRLQLASRFLVLSTWNEKGEEGVFPGKLIEYMMMNKPIISIVNGELGNAEVTEIIDKYKLGISCESAVQGSGIVLYEWLKAQAIQYSSNKSAIHNPDREGISKEYDWHNIVERFCEIIDE